MHNLVYSQDLVGFSYIHACNLSDLIFYHLTYKLSQLKSLTEQWYNKGEYNKAAVFGFECEMEALRMHSVCMGKMEV